MGRRNRSANKAKIMVMAVKKPVLKVPPKLEAINKLNPQSKTKEARIMAFPVPLTVWWMAVSISWPLLRSNLKRARK